MFVKTNLILFIIFIEISDFYYTDSQFYGENSSVCYLMPGSSEPGFSYQQKILSVLGIAFAIPFSLDNIWPW